MTLSIVIYIDSLSGNRALWLYWIYLDNEVQSFRVINGVGGDGGVEAKEVGVKSWFYFNATNKLVI